MEIRHNGRVLSAPAQRFVAIVLAYLGPLAVIPLVVVRTDADVQWHARQGLLLFACEAGVFLVLTSLTGLTVLSSLAGGIAIGALTWVAWIAVLALHLMAILAGLEDRRLSVPLVSALVSRLGAGSR